MALTNVIGTALANHVPMRLAAVAGSYLLFTCATCLGRIGETPIQCIERYGPPKDTPMSKAMDKASPLIEGAVHHTCEYQGWKLRVAFLQLDGPAVRIEYQKLANGQSPMIKDYELKAIMDANTPPGMAWKQIPYTNPDLPNTGLQKFTQPLAGALVGEKMWQRNDGAILWFRSNIIVRVELPAAREYEAQLKQQKDQKARASVPHF
jgi:hypothetical protein